MEGAKTKNGKNWPKPGFLKFNVHSLSSLSLIWNPTKFFFLAECNPELLCWVEIMVYI